MGKCKALWCLNTAVKHHSLNSNEGISELFKEMFPDSDIAKSFTCGKDKTGYIIRFGLASFFKKQLVDGINKAGPFVLMFDESLDQASKKKQFDIHVRYWEDDRVQSRYFGSQFLGYGRAEDLLHHIKVSSFLYSPTYAVSCDHSFEELFIHKDFVYYRMMLANLLLVTQNNKIGQSPAVT